MLLVYLRLVFNLSSLTSPTPYSQLPPVSCACTFISFSSEELHRTYLPSRYAPPTDKTCTLTHFPNTTTGDHQSRRSGAPTRAIIQSTEAIKRWGKEPGMMDRRKGLLISLPSPCRNKRLTDRPQPQPRGKRVRVHGETRLPLITSCLPTLPH